MKNSSPPCFTDSSSFSVPNTFIGIVLLNSKIRSTSSCNNNNTLLLTRSELLRDFATREFNAFLWVFLLVITFLLLRRLFNVFTFLYKARTIPGPPASCKIDQVLATELNERLIKTANLNPLKVADFIIDRIGKIRVGGSINCELVSQRMAFTLMGATFFGDGFLTWPKAAIYEELLMMVSKESCFWASYNVTPFWTRGFWRYQRACKKLRGLTEEILHCRKSCESLDHIDQNVRSESSNPETKSANGAQCRSNDQQNSKEELYGNIMRVMLHGSEATAVLFANVLTNLIKHVEIQDKVYSEISMVGRNPLKYEHEDVYRMPLLLATIYDSARLLPTGPMLQRCSMKQDLRFATGVTIPAGAVLVVPVQLVQKDDINWGKDASDFNPYRFLSNVTEGSGSEEQLGYGISSFVLNDPNEKAAFLPFGSGTLCCIGQKFVIQDVATLLASLLNKYEIRFNSGSDGDSEPLKNLPRQYHPNSQIQFVRRGQ